MADYFCVDSVSGIFFIQLLSKNIRSVYWLTLWLSEQQFAWVSGKIRACWYIIVFLVHKRNTDENSFSYVSPFIDDKRDNVSAVTGQNIGQPIV
ncbi:hypothetical protein ACNH6B_08770 [Shewanella basaltis]|uniref:hypothetical protein n=1 Tax=Shewanella basaltis TaxID=472183 RepID=UPI003AAA2D17